MRQPLSGQVTMENHIQHQLNIMGIAVVVAELSDKKYIILYLRENLKYFIFPNDITNYSLLQQDVWNQEEQ